MFLLYKNAPMPAGTGQTCLCSRWSAKVAERKKADVFGLDVSMGLGWPCGLHPARKRSNGGLGALEDSPN